MSISSLADLGAPLIRLSRLGTPRPVFVKAEYLHVSGSTYDRIAGRALDRHPGDGPVIVAGTGSEALAFAMALAPRHRALLAVVPEGTLGEHLALLVGAKAEIHHSPKEEGLFGAGRWAERLAKVRGYPVAHSPIAPEPTAEMFEATLGAELVELVRQIPEADRPQSLIAPLGDGGLLEGLRRALANAGLVPEIFGTIHPLGPSLQDGATDRESAPKGFNTVEVSDEDAYRERVSLARQEGVLIGLASAAAASVARLHAENAATMFVALDAGDRYFSIDRAFAGSA